MERYVRITERTPIPAIQTPAPNSDFEEVSRAFNERGVKYLVIGGHAVMLYTELRYTRDLDIRVEAAEESAPRKCDRPTSWYY